MSNEAWVAAQEKAESFYVMALNKSSPGWFKLIDDYYMKILDDRVADNEAEMVRTIMALEVSFDER